MAALRTGTQVKRERERKSKEKKEILRRAL